MNYKNSLIMWIKHLANGMKIVEGDKPGQTWLSSPLDTIVRVDMVLPQHLFGKNHRQSLYGPGPYHQAVKARATIGGKPFKIAEYVQRFDGKVWLTVEADYTTGKIKSYISEKRIGT